MKAPPDLPGLDCGSCGSPTCADFAERLRVDPLLLPRCIHLERAAVERAAVVRPAAECPAAVAIPLRADGGEPTWRDTLDREFDFFLECLPGDPGPREVILPHNPILTRELEVRVGDHLVGRPLGMSCGCPITHCGVVMEVDPRTGVIAWCVTGPLTPREKGFKDLGYYAAEAYEGIVRQARCELRIGARYFFQPRRCMLQWRHSGLLNFMSRTSEGTRVRLEGLWIG